jgi:hypothetical protein
MATIPRFEQKVREHADCHQSLHGTGTRPSADLVERVLESAGWGHERIRGNRCNANIHTYDWPVTNTNEWRRGLRRFWFCAQNPLGDRLATNTRFAAA